MVSRSPQAWVESTALSFPDLWDALNRHHPANHPVSYFMILVIFFEETMFCNVKQAGTQGRLGVGFGQLEVSNKEKKEFYSWMGLPTNYQAVAEQMLDDSDLAVKVHCKYFQYLNTVKHKGLDGCLSAQVGSHGTYIPLFKKGAGDLEKAFNANDRKGCINALNYARANSAKGNNTPEHLFKDFWEFILPDEWFTSGL